MGFDLVKMTVSSKRHVPTPFGNKDAFYSESLEIPSDLVMDRSSAYAFMNQRLDLTYLLDYYYSVPATDGSLPNTEVWPFVVARVKSMQGLYEAFPDILKNIIAFTPETYLGTKR